VVTKFTLYASQPDGRLRAVADYYAVRQERSAQEQGPAPGTAGEEHPLRRRMKTARAETVPQHDGA